MMKPIEFKGVNVTYAKDQDEYLDLPGLKRGAPQHELVTCWRLSFRERLKMLFTGKLWLSIWTFGHPLQPLLPTVNAGDVLHCDEIKALKGG